MKQVLALALMAVPLGAQAEVTAETRDALIADVTAEIGNAESAAVIVDCGLAQLDADAAMALNQAADADARDEVMTQNISLDELLGCAGDAIP